MLVPKHPVSARASYPDLGDRMPRYARHCPHVANKFDEERTNLDDWSSGHKSFLKLIWSPQETLHPKLKECGSPRSAVKLVSNLQVSHRLNPYETLCFDAHWPFLTSKHRLTKPQAASTVCRSSSWLAGATGAAGTAGTKRDRPHCWMAQVPKSKDKIHVYM